MTQAREDFERRRNDLTADLFNDDMSDVSATDETEASTLNALNKAYNAGITDPLVLELVRAATDEIVSRVNQHWPRSKTEIALHEAITRYESAIKVE